MTIGLFGAPWKLDPLGVAAGLAAAVSFAFYAVLGHDLLQRYDRWAVFLFAMMGSVITAASSRPCRRITRSSAATSFQGVSTTSSKQDAGIPSESGMRAGLSGVPNCPGG